MSSQVLYYEPAALASILAFPESRRLMAFGQQELTLHVARGLKGEALLRVHVDPGTYGPDVVPLFCDDLYALLLTAGPLDPTVSLPRPLDEVIVGELLDHLQTALLGLATSAHEALEFCEAIGVARASAPVTRPRQSRCRSITTVRGDLPALCNVLAPDLARLDDKLTAYRDILHGTGLDTAVVRLGLQAELGSRLTLQAAGDHFLPMLRQHPSDRSTLSLVWRSTTNRLEVFEGMLKATYAAELRGTSWLTCDVLREAHSKLTKDLPGSERGGQWRRKSILVPSALNAGLRFLELPDGLDAEMLAFVEAFDADAWTDLHPVLRAGLAHLEWRRMRPFGEANGRLGRLLLTAMLEEDGISSLPLDYVLHWNLHAYQEAVHRALRCDNICGFLQFLVTALERSLDLGREWVGELAPHRKDVLEALKAKSIGIERYCDNVAVRAVSMVLGPDTQIAYRAGHAATLCWAFEDSKIFDEIICNPPLSVHGFAMDNAFSLPIARRLAAMPAKLTDDN